LLVIDHRALRSVLDAAPGLAEAMSRVIAERQAALAAEGKVAPANANTEERTSQLLGRIRRFFSL
jgi:hypothetical protein